MKKSVFLPVLLLTTTVGFSISFPQIVVGAGTECIILVSNKSASIWKSDFNTRQGNNEPWVGTLWVNDLDITGSNGFILEVPPLATVKLVLTGGQQLRVGYLEMDPDINSSVLDVAISFFYNFYDPQGDLIDSVSIPPSMFAGDEFLLPVERSAVVNTGFAWCPGILEGPFTVVLTLYRVNGTVYQQKDVTFEGHAAQFFSDVFDNVPVNFLGLMRVESERLFHLAGIRIEYTESGFQYSGTPPDDFIP